MPQQPPAATRSLLRLPPASPTRTDRWLAQTPAAQYRPTPMHPPPPVPPAPPAPMEHAHAQTPTPAEQWLPQRTAAAQQQPAPLHPAPMAH